MIRPEDIKALRKIRSITTRAERFAELAHAGQVEKYRRAVITLFNP